MTNDISRHRSFVISIFVQCVILKLQFSLIDPLVTVKKKPLLVPYIDAQSIEKMKFF